MLHPFRSDGESVLFGVFDGHGLCGHTVAQEAMHSLYFELELSDLLSSQPEAALVHAFEATQEHLEALAAATPVEVDAADSGACACLALLRSSELWVAGAGDCRVVLGSRHVDGGFVPKRLTVDHHVDVPAERERIVAAGGFVSEARVDQDGDEIPSRSYKDLSNKRLGPGLRLSRSLGDLSAERDGLLTPTPEMCRHSVDSDDEILILASDGVFEFIDDAKAVTIVANVKAGGGSASDACASLVKQAALYWRLHEEGYRDDITCIVVYLQPALEALSPTD